MKRIWEPFWIMENIVWNFSKTFSKHFFNFKNFNFGKKIPNLTIQKIYRKKFIPFFTFNVTLQLIIYCAARNSSQICCAAQKAPCAEAHFLENHCAFGFKLLQK